MKDRRWLVILPVFGVAALLSGSAMGEVADVNTVTYHGIRPTDPGGRDGLWNPERGFRIETLIAEPPGQPAWGPAHHLLGLVPEGFSDDWWLLDCARYREHGLTMAQTYCYLDSYVGVPLPDEKLECLRRSLWALRSHGYKALLRFAYERTTDRTAGPTLDDIRAHMAQLRPIVRQNADIIHVLQAGFVGAWGEWHSSAHGLETDHAKLADIVASVLDMLPNGRMTQVRVPKYKRWVLEEPVLGGFQQVTAETAHTTRPDARIGFHDDGFLAGETDGGTWPEAPNYGSPGNPEFDYMTDESPYVPVDGELFWSDQGGKIDGLRAAERMRLHHYTTFSLAHSFSDREGAPYSIDDWMKTEITERQVRERSLPLSDGYFEDEGGQPVPRTQFEYIRDHLGYRIELRSATFPRSVRAGHDATARARLVNRGFSVPHNPRPVLAVLIDEKGRVVSVCDTNADPRTWQPFAPGDPTFAPLEHVVSAKVRADVDPGQYRLGLWLPDAAESLRYDPRYAVRVANRDVPWWTDRDGTYGANVLGTITVVR